MGTIKEITKDEYYKFNLLFLKKGNIKVIDKGNNRLIVDKEKERVIASEIKINGESSYRINTMVYFTYKNMIAVGV